jgi:hypothetical protein
MQNTDADPGDTSSLSPFTITALPHRIFDGLCKALIYEEPIRELLLRAFTGAVRRFHGRVTDLGQSAWYNTALLNGPPGSVKTSLARAPAR